jgi:hypothetical protein
MPNANAAEFAQIIGPLSMLLLGEPNRAYSSEFELRYGAKGSLSVDLGKGTWFDHEAGEGGGVLDLVTRETKLTGAERFDWLKQHGFVSDTIHTNGSTAPRAKIVATYDYTDEGGALLFQVCRFDPKDFRQRRPDGHGDWAWSVKGVRHVPYRLPQLLENDDRVVCIVEGEKAADRLWKIGIPATCSAGGAGKWREELNEFFRGADVVVIPDRDPQKLHPKTKEPLFHPDGRPILPGQDHAQMVAKSLSEVATRVRVLELWKHWPEMPWKGDAFDWVDSGGTADKLYALIEKTPDWRGPQANTLILSSRAFVTGFVPPDYIIDGLLQRRFLYSLTGKTGAGKTAILLLIVAHVAEAKKIGDREVEKGRVLYFAGENADDVRMRWIALAQQIGFDIDTIDVHFIAGTFKISAMQDRIRSEIKQIGDIALVIIDTSAAYFEGDDENDNKQNGDHARRLRALTTMPGAPCVIAACHPVKNAADDNLIPRGGGAFLNEVDGNLTAAKTMSGPVAVHWQGKFRGPEFVPIHFTLRTVTHERLKDSKGRLIPTVVASPISEQGLDDMARAERSREDELLVALLDPANCKASQIELARRLGWLMRDGKPYHVLVGRVLKALEKAKLITVERGQIILTKKGKTAAEKV